MLIGGKQEAEKLTIEQGEEQKKAIFVLPKQDQLRSGGNGRPATRAKSSR